MTKRPTTTAAQKLEVLGENGVVVLCAGCCEETLIDVVQYDHIQPLALGGAHTVSNLQPLCLNCHAKKTRGSGATTHGSDIGNISKTRRQQKKRLAEEALARGEAVAEKMKPKRKIASRGFDKTLRKKVNGKVERKYGEDGS